MNEVGISKSELSKIINGLVDENILEKKIVKGEKGYGVVESIEVLYKIFKRI